MSTARKIVPTHMSVSRVLLEKVAQSLWNGSAALLRRSDVTAAVELADAANELEAELFKVWPEEPK